MRSIGSAANLARGALAGFLTATAVRRVGQFAASITEASSALVEQAEALGVSASELETFHRALRGDGATIQQINQGLSQLTRNIGLAAQGTGTAGDTFRRLGIDIRNADGTIRGSLDVYRDLVAALEALDPAARAAALGLTVGEEAARVLGASVARGAVALRASELREAGFGQATDAQLQAVKELGDTVRTVTDSIRTLATVVLANLADDITLIALRVREAVSVLIQLEQTSQTISNVIVELARRAIGLAQAMYELRTIFQIAFSATIAGRIARITRGLVNFARRFAPVTRLLNRLLVRGRTGDADEINSILDVFTRLIGIGTGGFFGAGIFGSLRNLDSALRDTFAPLEDFESRVFRASDAALELQFAVERLGGTFARVREQAPEIAQQYEEAFARIQRRVELLDIFSTPALLRRPGLTDGAVQFTREQLDAMRATIAEEAGDLNRQLVAALFAPAAGGGEEAEALVARVRRGLAGRLAAEPIAIPFNVEFDQVERLGDDLRRELSDTAAQAVRLTDLLSDPSYVDALERQFGATEDALSAFNAQLDILVETGRLSADVADRLRESMSGLADETSLVAEFAAQAGSTIANSFADAILQAESFRDVLGALAATLFRIASQTFIGGTLTRLFAGFFAQGGRIPGGQFGVVGERGPELIQGPANVIPLDAGMLAGGGDINVNVTVQGDPQPEFTQAAALEGARRAVREAMANRNIRFGFQR